MDPTLSATTTTTTIMTDAPARLPALEQRVVTVLGQHPPQSHQQEDERSRLLLLLQRIDHVEVCALPREPRPRHRMFTINMYWKAPLPSTAETSPKNDDDSKTDGSLPSMPDLQVEHSYDEFVDLRHAIYAAARDGHGQRSCVFCATVANNYVQDAEQPHSWLKWLHRREQIAVMLTAFLDNAVHFTARLPLQRSADRRMCAGQAEVPRLLHQFLLPAAAWSSVE